MRNLYRILTAVLAFSGTISLVLTGEVNPVLSLTGIGLIPGYYRYVYGMPPAPKWVISGLSVLTVIIFLFDAFIISDDYLVGVAHLTITFQALKSFDLKEPWDHLQVYFMSLLQLIIVSELIFSIIFGIIFILFLIAFVAAMVIAHFMKEGASAQIGIRRPVIVISLLTFLISVVIFAVSPRITGGLWGRSYMKSIRTAGFSETVDFGSFGNVKLDPTIVMRIELGGNAKGPFYWRGMTLNYFDGTRWRDTLTERKWIYKDEGVFTIHPFDEETAVTQRIFLEPMDTNVLFGLREIAAVESKGRILFRDDAGALFLPAKKGKRINYLVYSEEHFPEVKRGEIDLYLQLPAKMERIRQLSAEIASRRKDDFDKAKGIERYLEQNYTYSLNTKQPPEGTGPIEYFLFDSKRGYCEHYATAMVLMLRSVGIPSRIVTGFVGGEPNEYGGYLIIRSSDAHSWVEAGINGTWSRFDPTPPVVIQRQPTVTLYLDMLRLMWDRYVIGFSSTDQREMFRNIASVFRIPDVTAPKIHIQPFPYVTVLLIFCAMCGFVIVKALHRRKLGFVSEKFIKVRKVLKKKGAKIQSSATPADVAREAARMGLDGSVSAFVQLYEKHRFGGKQIDKTSKVRIQKLLREITKKS